MNLIYVFIMHALCTEKVNQLIYQTALCSDENWYHVNSILLHLCNLWPLVQKWEGRHLIRQIEAGYDLGPAAAGSMALLNSQVATGSSEHLPSWPAVHFDELEFQGATHPSF